MIRDASAASPGGAVELVLRPRRRDLGGFFVRRVLPAGERRMVGPFIFFDHMGPAELPAGQGIDVRPHPHIGLATVTYLFEGELLHRDSLGCVQPIEPGAVNLMTAGRGIVHSERSGSSRDRDARIEGIQTWLALPDHLEECAPAFAHFAAESLPAIARDGVDLRLIMGEGFGATSPVTTYSETFYAEARMRAGSDLELPASVAERACYVVRGAVDVGGHPLQAGEMAVLAPGAAASLRAVDGDAHAMLCGGAPVGERHLWWNLVSSSPARIEQAKADWAAGRFPPVPGETELIPLPES